jgi:hypothetical protein
MQAKSHLKLVTYLLVRDRRVWRKLIIRSANLRSLFVTGLGV